MEALVGAGIVVTLPDDLKRVALADDSIATVEILNPREILILGTKVGQTTVFTWLADETRQTYVLTIRQDLSLLREMLEELDERIVVDTAKR